MPPRTTLPDTLAQRIQFLRHQLDITPSALARKANVAPELIEDLEGGLVMFLAPSIRQQIARALRVKSFVLEEVEKRPAVLTPETRQALSEEDASALLEQALERPNRTFLCPNCSAKLNVRIFERRDLEDHPVNAIKIACSHCLFRLEKD